VGKIIGIAFISIIVVLGALYLFNSKSNTTFNDFVLDTGEITSIEIIKTSTDKEIVIENGNDVKGILEHFYEAELKENEMGSIDFNESYWMTLKSNGARKLGMTVYDEKYLLIFDYNQNKQTSYQIISDFNAYNIEKYFN